jgi:hypothetical protein
MEGRVMKYCPSRQFQRGYLLEIPILFVLVIVILSVLLPNLPPWGQKITIAIAAIPILFFLFYMIVVPGWMPGDKGRLKWPWNWLVFLLVAIPIIGIVGLIIIGK